MGAQDLSAITWYIRTRPPPLAGFNSTLLLLGTCCCCLVAAAAGISSAPGAWLLAGCCCLLLACLVLLDALGCLHACCCWMLAACCLLSAPFCCCCCLGLLAAVGAQESLFVRIESSCIPSDSGNDANFIISLRSLYRHVPTPQPPRVQIRMHHPLSMQIKKIILTTHMNDRTQ